MIRIGALGDVLLTRRLTYSLGRAGFRSTVMAPARHASLLLADSWIEAVLDSEAPVLASAFAGAWPESAGRFDVAIVISRSTDLAGAATCAATSVIRVPPAPALNNSPISMQWAEAAQATFETFSGPMPFLGTQTRDAAFTGATLIHPGSGSPGKNWPIERFLELSRKLRTAGHNVVWIRGPAEIGAAEAWDGERLDRPSLSTLAATLAASRLFIGNDSGVSHLAGAVGACAWTLFGPTRSEVWRPDGPRVRVIDSADGTMAGLSLDAVLNAVSGAPETE